MYPMLCEGVSAFEETVGDSVCYYIKNADDEEFEISEALLLELLKADGTRKLKISRKLVNELKANGIIHTTRFIRENKYNRFILLPIGKRVEIFQDACILINSFMPITAILLFLMACLIKTQSNSVTSSNYNLWVYIFGAIVSVFGHEIGHLISGIAYGYYISQLGVLLAGIIPIGAYVEHAEKTDISVSEQIQFSMAGIEVNLFLAGLFLVLSMNSFQLSLTFVILANLNVALALFNSIPGDGLDGEKALSSLLGIESLSTVARKWLLNKNRRRRLMKSGIKGYACMGVFAISLLADVFTTMLVWINIFWLFVDLFF